MHTSIGTVNTTREFIFFYNHLFVLFLPLLRIQYISLTRCVVIRMTLLICLPSSSIYIFIILNSCVCVSEPVYASPSSSILVHIYRHFHVYCLCYVLYLFPCFCAFLLFPKLNRPLCQGVRVYWCNHTPTHILILWFRLYFHFVICAFTMSKSNIKLTTT